jgi:beta-phosphoglucomutase-like phosphatase (HAD superfamily)
VIFDLDGVITDTARVHAAAWKRLFDRELAQRTSGGAARPFDLDDYRRYVDNRSRRDGVQALVILAVAAMGLLSAALKARPSPATGLVVAASGTVLATAGALALRIWWVIGGRGR